MTAATIELGENALAFGLAVVTLGTLVVNNWSSRRAQKAAEATESTAGAVMGSLGRLEEGQDVILSRLDDHEQRIIVIEKKVVA